MQRYRDACNSRRAASDLLSWSMGAKPRHGNDYDRGGYQAPKNPAKPPRSAAETIARLRARARHLGLNVLRAVLVWWLSFDEKNRNG
jgi:hypothetical protein